MLQNAKDVKSWNERLKAQAEGHFDNYVKRRIDLSAARNDEPLRIAGEFLYVEDAYDEETSVAQIKLNRNINDALDLEKGVEIYTIFTEVYITNDALQDEWIDIVFGINFVYKKKIADGGGAWPNPITTAIGVDLQLLPGAGGITQIGNAGATSHGLAANDDLFVSGKFEADGSGYFDGSLTVASILDIGSAGYLRKLAYYGSRFSILETHEFTVTVGLGSTFQDSAANLAPSNSIILSVLARVTQDDSNNVPTTVDVGRTNGGNLDEFIDGLACNVNSSGSTPSYHDAATISPLYNGSADTLRVTLDAAPTGTPVIVRLEVFYIDIADFTS